MAWINQITPLYDGEAEAALKWTKKVTRLTLSEAFSSSKQSKLAFLQTHLPLLHCSAFKEPPFYLSFYLVSFSRPDAFKFFFELLTRFSVPGKRLPAAKLFAVDFHFKALPNELFTAVELAVRVETAEELEAIKEQRAFIENQVRLGMVSAYHALRILEMTELLLDQKTVLIQDCIGSLVRHKKKRFDARLIAEMQAFLITSSEAFRSERSLKTLNRLICLLYYFKRIMTEEMNREPGRHVCRVKLMRSQLKQNTPVLGVLTAVNLTSPQEVFEEPNFLKAVETIAPHLKPVEGSFLSSFTGRSDLKIHYVEFEGECDHDLLNRIRKRLPEAVINQVEQLLHPIFMPHNEEELIRNIVTLSKQLRFVRDIPQVIITFKDHTTHDLSFTVIVLRLLKKGDSSLEKLFSKAKTSLEFIKERVKVVGLLRKIYPKEANVFQLRLKKKPFMRQDRSIDLYKARQVVLEQLAEFLGPVRDYNGGMLARHLETFETLKTLLGGVATFKEFLLENFFYGINPVIMRSLLEPESIKRWFLFFLDTLEDSGQEKERIFYKEKEDDGFIFMSIASKTREPCWQIQNYLEEDKLNAINLASVLMKENGLHILSIIYRVSHAEEKNQLREAVANLIGAC